MSAALAAVERETMIAAIGFDEPPRVFRCRYHVRWKDGSVSRHEIDARGCLTMVMAVPIAWFCMVIPAGRA